MEEASDDPYKYRADDPHVGPARPISQGDVFKGVPIVGAATPDPRQSGTFRGTVRKNPAASLGILITHPCASRSQTTHRLNAVVSVAPVVRCPTEFSRPWDGHYELFPLPGLIGGEDYVAQLNWAGPVSSDLLSGKRVASLNGNGILTLYHRLAMNSLRFPEIPAYFRVQAAKLTAEIDLWEHWVAQRRSEEGFQEWLDQPFSGQPLEDHEGETVVGSESPTGESRRAALAWNAEEVRDELAAEIG